MNMNNKRHNDDEVSNLIVVQIHPHTHLLYFTFDDPRGGRH